MWSEGNGQLQAPPQNDPPTASTVTAPLPPDPAVPCDVVAQRKDGSTRRQNADTCALAADRPQSLSVIGTLARRAPCRFGAQNEQHPWRNERARIVQFGASGTFRGALCPLTGFRRRLPELRK